MNGIRPYVNGVPNGRHTKAAASLLTDGHIAFAVKGGLCSLRCAFPPSLAGRALAKSDVAAAPQPSALVFRPYVNGVPNGRHTKAAASLLTDGHIAFAVKGGFEPPVP